jgi:exodeoxyribonuclease V gamma subunit
MVALERAAGVLPHGRMGEILFEQERDRGEQFAKKVATSLPARILDPIPVDIKVSGMRLTGVLTNLSAGGLLTYRCAKVTANDRVSSWIRHLVLNIVKPEDAALTTRYIGEDCTLTFGPFDRAQATLNTLVELYLDGLGRPLHFFPRTACAYAEVGEINDKVLSIWASRNDDATGEREDPYYRLAFRGIDPLDHEFERCARIVFGPMQEVLNQEKLG